ncbi:hypothetical protein D3C85_806040 [compost metagenome]
MPRLPGHLLPEVLRGEQVILQVTDFTQEATHGCGIGIEPVLPQRVTHKLLLVIGVEDGEAIVNANRGAVPPQDANGNAMKRAHRNFVRSLLASVLHDALFHLFGCLIGKGHNHLMFRPAALTNDISCAPGQHASLAGTCARYNQRRLVQCRGYGFKLALV